MKRPAFQFYPSDWRTDAALQSCSIAARGLWHEMLCIMHECIPYGHLAINGMPMEDRQVARVVGVDLKTYRKLLATLEQVGVCSRSARGLLFSRRMVRDEELRHTRTECGKLGGNPNLVNQNLNQASNQKPTPSSSSSSSSSKQPKPKGAVASLPDWLDADLWKRFVEHRRALRKPMTPYAEELMLGKLADLRRQGYDPPSVIDHAIEGGWQKLFAPKLQATKGKDFGQRRIDTVSALTGRNVIELPADALDRKIV